MSANTAADAIHGRLPARYDHVGSFLRPDYLLQARQQFARGEIDAMQLRRVEDRAIDEVVRLQQRVGMKTITDGEYRRAYFHIDFLDQLGGVRTERPAIINKPSGMQELAPPVMHVTGKIRHTHDIEVDNFRYLQTRLLPGNVGKITIPSPTMLHFRGGRAGISPDAYPRLDPEFYDDLARSFADELHSLARAGCNYVQLDDTNLAYLCDPQMRHAAKQRGDDPDALPYIYAELINKVVAQKPPGMLLAMHVCRGNFRSTHAASGAYEPVAEALLTNMNLDAYFLEYDDARSGDFTPLRFLTAGKTAVLGLITTKLGTLESKDEIKRRIDEAATEAPLGQLALSPQCGFASTVEGNDISWDNQYRKLELVVQIAEEIWGSH